MRSALILLFVISFFSTPCSEGAELVHIQIPETYTGTGYGEWIHYQIPDNYDPSGPGHPLAVCWHAFTQNCKSVANQSQIDESCNNRDWIYLSVTGATKYQLSSLLAQKHGALAIQYLEEELGVNIDRKRIYMIGLSGGGLISASFAARHLGMDDYRIAGVVSVAAAHDLADLYHNDPGIVYWLEQIIGGSPVDFPFEYNQIGTIFRQNDTYVPNESMGMNLAHGMPVFVTYADNDPATLIPEQNDIFVDLLEDLNANYIVDHHVSAPNPHSWSILDVEAALDFIGAYSLDDQNTESIHFLADRDAEFHWLTVQQEMTTVFSEVSASIDMASNEINVTQADAISGLTADLDQLAGISQSSLMGIDFQSNSSIQQQLGVEPVSDPPAFVVDAFGKLFDQWNFDQGRLTIFKDPLQHLCLQASFETYALQLGVDPSCLHFNDMCALTISQGDAFDPCLLAIAIEQVMTPLGKKHHLLLNPLPPSILLYLALDGQGAFSMDVRIPADPGLAGISLYLQAVTYGSLGVEKLSNLAVAEIQE